MNKVLSTTQRLQLIRTLNSLPLARIVEIETVLEVPQSDLPGQAAPQGIRTVALIQHLESPSGKGLGILLDVLRKMKLEPFEDPTSSGENHEIQTLLAHIESGDIKDYDLKRLLDILNQESSQQESPQISQSGKYNINISEGYDVHIAHIGDRTEVSWDEEAIKSLIEVIREQPPEIPSEPAPLSRKSVIFLATGVSILVIFLRFLGVMQPLELLVYDLFLSLRFGEVVDKHVTVVGVTGIDSANDSISDQQILQLLNQLQSYNPRTIGLDIYRYQSDVLEDSNTSQFCQNDTSDYCQLVQYLKDQSNIVSTCQVSEGFENPDAYPAYPGIDLANLGFTDSIRDTDDVIRRHLLALPSSAIDELDTPCDTSASFNLRLTFLYLNSFGISIPDKRSFKLGHVDFQEFILGERAGGYKRSESNSTGDGFQLLLNYRTPPNRDEHSFQLIKYDISKSSEDLDLINFSDIRDRIVLVGYLVIDPDKNPDVAPAPKGYEYLGLRQSGEADYGNVPGVFIQAHKTSQLVNAVLEDRQLLWVLPKLIEVIWIIIWGTIAGIIVWFAHGFKLVVVSLASVISITIGCYCIIVIWGAWVPIIPSIFVFSLTILSIRPGLSLLR